MGKFFYSPLNKIKESVERSLERKTVLLLFEFAAFAVGIVLGVAIRPTGFIYNYYSLNAERYFYIAMGGGSSAFSVLLSRMLTNLGYYLVFFGLSFSALLLPCQVLITIFRGYILSLSLTVFTLHFGVTGVLIGVFLVVLQNLITSTSIILFSVSTFDCRNKAVKTSAVKMATKRLRYAVFFYALSLVGALIEFLILSLLLRPMSFYF